jgi:hypothetical protein
LNEVSMKGRLYDGLGEARIQINYDPLPTSTIYLENRTETRMTTVKP